MKGEGERGNLGAREGVWGARGRKKRNACKDAIVFSKPPLIWYAKISSPSRAPKFPLPLSTPATQAEQNLKNRLHQRTKSWLGLKDDLLSGVTLRQVFFTVHIPQVRIQVTMLQINKQAQKCLLALNVIQNVVFDGGEITYNYVVIFVVTCGIWPVKETSPSPF